MPALVVERVGESSPPDYSPASRQINHQSNFALAERGTSTDDSTLQMLSAFVRHMNWLAGSRCPDSRWQRDKGNTCQIAKSLQVEALFSERTEATPETCHSFSLQGPADPARFRSPLIASRMGLFNPKRDLQVDDRSGNGGIGGRVVDQLGI